MEGQQRLFRPRGDPDAVAPAAPPAPPERRSRRDTLIAVGLTVIVAGTALDVVAALLVLLAVVDLDEAPGASVPAEVFQLVAAVVALVAFGLASRAMFGSPTWRAARLSRAAFVAAVSLSVSVLGLVVQAVVDADAGLPRTGIAGEVCAVVGDVAFLAAAALVALAFRAGRVLRDQRLGRASVCVTAGFAAGILQAALFGIFFADIGLTSGLVGGVWVIAVGAVVAAWGGVVAAAAFFGSSSSEEVVDAPQRRDGFLARAAGVLAAGHLVAAVGATLSAASLEENGYTGKEVTASWLNAISAGAIAAAFACFAVGFLRSRRSAG